LNKKIPMGHLSYFMDCFGESTFQTFDDKGKDRSLIRQFHGTIEDHVDDLVAINKKGGGIFFCPNRTDLKGRRSDNIIQIRSLFIDLDGSPLPENFDLRPHLIVNTSPSRYHVYWLVDKNDKINDDLLDPLKRGRFRLYQRALADKFNSDKKCCDLPRVMRVAGFLHMKRNPYPVKVIDRYFDADPYSIAEIRDTLKLKRPDTKIRNYTNSKSDYNGHKHKANGVRQGNRNNKLFEILICCRRRGDSYEYMEGQAVNFGSSCKPPMDELEVKTTLQNVWNNYGIESLPNTSNSRH